MCTPDLTVAVDDERGALVRKLALIDVYSEQFHKLMPEVAQEEDVVIWVTPLLEGLLRRGVIGADANDLGTKRIEICNVLRMAADLTFARSGEALREEEQDDGLAPVVTDGMHLAICPHEGKVRGGISYVNHCHVLVRSKVNRKDLGPDDFREGQMIWVPVCQWIGLPAFFHAVVPPSMIFTLVKPMSWRILAARDACPPAPHVVMIGVERS